MRRIIAAVLIASLALVTVGTTVIRPSTDVVAGNCSSRDFRLSQRAITEQTAALTAQDFRRARTYSSQDFRSNVSEDQFVGIIARGYDFLLRDPEITFDRCEQDGADRLVISASFTVAGVGNQLQYVMVNEDNGWFVNGADATLANTLPA